MPDLALVCLQELACSGKYRRIASSVFQGERVRQLPHCHCMEALRENTFVALRVVSTHWSKLGGTRGADFTDFGDAQHTVIVVALPISIGNC